MERACCLFQIKPDRLQEYLAAHQVWPELCEAIQAAGIRNYSLFYRPDGLVACYMEGEDIRQSLRELGKTEISARWEAGMAPFFAAGPGERAPGEPEWLTSYFHLA